MASLLITLLLVFLMAAAYKLRTTVVQNFNQGVSLFDDFLTGPPVGYAGVYYGTATGGSGFVDLGSSGSYPGYVRLRGFGSGDKACVYFIQSVHTENSALLVAETRLKLTTLLSGANTGQYYFGFVNSPNADIASVSDGAAFVYDKSISNNWILRVNKAGVATQIVTTIPVDILDTYLKVAITPNYVTFLKNNVLVGTINIVMDTLTALGPSVFVNKTGGVTENDVTIDAIGLYQQFITPRIFSNTVVTQ